MRHVSRTHKVALDWLFDRITLDPKIQNWYIDTKHQFADILYKDNFTRDEWISSPSAALRISAWIALPINWRRDTLNKKKKQDCGEIKARGDELDFNCLDKFPIREPSDCVKKPGDTQSIYRKTWREGKRKFKTRRSVGFSRKAEICIFWRIIGWSSGETCRDM